MDPRSSFIIPPKLEDARESSVNFFFFFTGNSWLSANWLSNSWPLEMNVRGNDVLSMVYLLKNVQDKL